MDKSKFAGALRTLFNVNAADRDAGQPADSLEPRLLNEMELWVTAGGEDTPVW